MATRDYNFVVGVETAAEPTASTPTDASDLTTKTYVDTAISTATIARSQVAAGTANHVLINSGTGAMSSEAALAVSRGGTNSSAALSNNRVMQSSSGAVVEAAAITASRALISDANGIPTHSAVTSTQLGYLSTATSDVQVQLDARISKSLVTTKGDIITATASSTPARLPVGTDGHFLKANSGTSTGLEWVSAAGSVANLSVQSKTTTFTASTADDVYLCSTSGGAYTVTLPTAVGNTGKVFTFIKTTTDASGLTIDGNSTETINGYTAWTFYQNKDWTQIVSDGSNWKVLNYGFEQQRVESADSSLNNYPASNVIGDAGSITLGPGEWEISYVVYTDQNGATLTVNGDGWIGTASGNSTSGRVLGSNNYKQSALSNGLAWGCVPSYRVLVTASTTYYAKIRISYSAGTPQYYYRISARRVGV